MKIVQNCPCCDSMDLESCPAVLAPFVADRIFGWVPFDISAFVKLPQNTACYAATNCKTLECKLCGFLFCDMRFDDEEMEKLYAGYRKEEYVALRDRYEPGYRGYNEKMMADGLPYINEIEGFLAKYLDTSKPFRILDYGGGTGINTPFKNGPIDIFDIGKTKPQFGKIVKKPKDDYDLIVCANLLEHVSYPLEILMRIRKLMQDGTVLFIEIPREASKTNYWHEHINKFTGQSIDRLINRSHLITLGVAAIDTAEFHPLFMACKKDNS